MSNTATFPTETPKISTSIRKIKKNFYFRTRVAGKEKLIRLTATTEKNADLEAAKYKALVAANSIEELAAMVAAVKKITLPHIAITWETALHRFAASVTRPRCGEKQLNAHIKYILEFSDFAKEQHIKTVNNITADLAARYFESLTCNPRSFNVRLKTMRLFFRVLCPDTPSPFRDIRLQPEIPKSKKNFTESELMAVFDAVDHSYPLSLLHREEMSLLFRILAYTGIRFKDACLITWDRFVDGWIDLTPYKTMKSNHPISIPQHPEIAKRLPPGVHTGYVMPQVAARYKHCESAININACRVVWWALEKEHRTYIQCGKHYPCRPDPIDGYGMHSFRHAFASFCATAGVPLGVVQELLGHNSVSITRIYARFSDSAKLAILALPGGDETPETAKLREWIRKQVMTIPEEKLKKIAKFLQP